MLKYGEYIFEQKKTFKVKDICIFQASPRKPYYNKYNNKECEIIHDYLNGNYTVKTKEGNSFLAEDTELTLKTAGQSNVAVLQDYIENKYKKPENNIEIVPGTRVIVIGKEGRVEYNNKGTVKKVDADVYLIDFDEDESKNQRAFTSLVKKDLVTAIDEPFVPVFKTGDKVKCVDNASKYFDKIGEIERIWDDGQCMVMFDMPGGIEGTPMKPHQIKIEEFSKNKNFKKEIPVSSPKDNTEKDTTEESEVKIITTEEEEDDDEEVSITSAHFKKEDLLEFSYTDFLLEDKISKIEETLANKSKYEEALKSTDLKEFKRIFIERSLKSTEIVESYFNFLIHKVANGLPVYRTLEQIDNEDLLRTKTKVRASDSKELTRKYSFDQGIIAYWKFKDAVVFKTI